MKKILKRSLAIFLCFTMIFNYSFDVLADENVESSEPVATYTENTDSTNDSNITEGIGELENEGKEPEDEEEFEDASPSDEEYSDDEDIDEEAVEEEYEEEPYEDVVEGQEELTGEQEEISDEELSEDEEEISDDGLTALPDEAAEEEIINEDEVIEEVEDVEEASPSNADEEDGENASEINEELEEEAEEENVSENDNVSKSDTEEVGEVEEASPSDADEVEEETETEIEEKVEEASPSEIEKLPMFAMMPMNMLGTSATVTTWADLTASIVSSSAGDVITLGDNITVDSTYTVPSDKDVTIDLNGHTIDGDSKQIFILNGKLTIDDSASGGTITGANGGYGGAIKIFDNGILTLDDGIFTGNSATYCGGAIDIESGGTFIMNGGKIIGNTASGGVGIAIFGGTFEMNGGEISGNTATNSGAGIGVFGGTFTMNDGEISGNTANEGAGIYGQTGNIFLYGGEIVNNIADKGAGVYVNSGFDKVYLGGGVVVKDNSSSSGDIGNIYILDYTSKLEISSTNPLTSGAEIYVTVEYDNASDWGAGKNVGQYFNSTMTDSNYQYFYFTNCGSVEKNVVYSVTKSGSNYITALPSSSVCKIGTTEYATLQDALSAVTSGQTIVVLQDVTYGTPLTINNGKTFTIDFDDSSSTHTFKWDVTVGQAYQQDIIIIEGNSNVTVKNMEFLVGTHDEHGNRIFKVNSTGKLTLNNMTLNSGDSIKNIPVQNNGGTVVIDGGNITTNDSTNGSILTAERHNPIVQNLGGTTTFKGNGTYTMQNSDTGAAWLGRVITQPAQSTDADCYNECGTIVIENGTFNNGNIVDVNGKGTITINDATYDTGNGPIIKTFHGGIKSNITINNITTSAVAFAQVLEELQTKINFQNGNVKYTPNNFCFQNNATQQMTSVTIKNGKFGPKTGSADIHDEINNLLASGATLTALTGDPDGYTYKVESSTPTPPPTPIPPHGGGSSGGGGGGGGAGIPKYDLEGNIILPTGIQNYGYDGTNPPNLTGNITISYWDYNTANAQVADIHYVQNIDSFVRGNNNPVITEWVGISTNTNSKVLWYRTNANGQILRNQFIQIGNNIYYFDNNGIMVTGQYTINGKVYNFETAVGATEGRFLY